MDTNKPVLRGQIRKSILEGVFYELLLIENFGIAIINLFIPGNHTTHKREHFGIPRKDDMRTANIKGKSLFGFRPAESAIVRLRFKDNDFFTPFMHESRQGDSGKSTTKNCSFHCSYVCVQNLNDSPL